MAWGLFPDVKKNTGTPYNDTKSAYVIFSYSNESADTQIKLMIAFGRFTRNSDFTSGPANSKYTVFPKAFLYHPITFVTVESDYDSDNGALGTCGWGTSFDVFQFL